MTIDHQRPGPQQHPSPPAWVKARKLLWPALAFTLLIAMPPGAAVVLIGVAMLARGAWRTIEYVRARDQEIADRAAAGRMITVGRDHAGQPVEIPEQTLTAHALILGATGSGKSTTMLTLLGDQISHGRPVVAIDLKGSPAFAADLQAAAEAAGRRFIQWSPDGDSHWNPLASGTATELKDKLLRTERFTEPHYQRAAERYLQLAIQVAQETARGRPLTLARVVELMSPDRLAAATRDASPARAERVRDYLGALTSDQNSAVRGLASRLAILSESETGPLLEPGRPEQTLDLRRALTGGEVVLFSLNSSSYGNLAAMLGTLAVQDLVAASGARLTRGDAAAPQALIAIDEFSALQGDNVLALMVRGRESRMGVLLATQELADLDRAGHGLSKQILGNTALKIVHRQDVPDSAETAAKLAGTVRVWEESYQQRPGAGGGVGRGARLVDRYVIEPEQVRTLQTGEAVVVTKSPRASTRLARIRRTTPSRGAER